MKKSFHDPASKLSDEYDIHGIVNISRVCIIFATPNKIDETLGPDLKRQCLEYLNRLVEVIRYKTRKYWLLPVSEYELIYADIEDLTEGFGNRKGHILLSEVSTVVNLPIKQENEVVDEINSCLKEEQRIPYSDLLILDSYNYIFTGQFNESIVTSNLALEIFIKETLRDILAIKYSNEKDINAALSSILEDTLHKTFRKNFLGDISHEKARETSDIYKRFSQSRDYRYRVIHRGERLNARDSEGNLTNILKINWYLLATYQVMLKQ